jgi:formamidopyrimidine-DNA glycosylase
MPELPEVETIRKQLQDELQGSRFLSVTTDNPKSFRPSFVVVKKNIIGQKIKEIGRQAKLIIFHLESRGYLLFHLKLTGRLLVRKAGEKTDDYTRSVFTLKTAKSKILELRFSDARKFGFVKLVKSQKEMDSLLREFGPEPFKDLILNKFTQVLERAGQAVKVVLMDQKRISGIGNIYANDALWLAKINPKTPAKILTPRQVKALYRAVLTVLKKGLKYGGASDQWYRQAHGEKGEYQEHFLVYGKNGEKCDRCKNIIKRVVLGSRGTFFCPQCQA